MKAFKKGHLYSYIDTLGSNEVEIELKKLPITPTSSTNPQTCGFTNVDFEFSSKGQYLERLVDLYLSVFVIEKRVPTNQQVEILAEKKLKVIRDGLEEGKSITQKIRREVKKEARLELVASTDPTRHYIHVAWDFDNNLVIADTTNKKELESLKDTLTKAEINLSDEKVHFDIDTYLKDIIDKPSDTLSDDFDVGTSVVMSDNSKLKSIVNYRNQDIVNDEIESNRERDKHPVQVGLKHHDSVEFVLNLGHEVMSVKSVNNDHSHMIKVVEKVEQIEFDEPEKSKYFHKIAVFLFMTFEIFVDLIKHRNKETNEILSYVTED